MLGRRPSSQLVIKIHVQSFKETHPSQEAESKTDQQALKYHSHTTQESPTMHTTPIAFLYFCLLLPLRTLKTKLDLSQSSNLFPLAASQIVSDHLSKVHASATGSFERSFGLCTVLSPRSRVVYPGNGSAHSRSGRHVPDEGPMPPREWILDALSSRIQR